METIFLNMENGKTNEPNRFAFNSSQRSDMTSLDKYVTLQNVYIYYTQKNIRKQYKNNKPKIITPKWNDESALPDGSYPVSDIQDEIEFIIKKPKTT